MVNVMGAIGGNITITSITPIGWGSTAFVLPGKKRIPFFFSMEMSDHKHMFEVILFSFYKNSRQNDG